MYLNYSASPLPMSLPPQSYRSGRKTDLDLLRAHKLRFAPVPSTCFHKLEADMCPVHLKRVHFHTQWAPYTCWVGPSVSICKQLFRSSQYRGLHLSPLAYGFLPPPVPAGAGKCCASRGDEHLTWPTNVPSGQLSCTLIRS